MTNEHRATREEEAYRRLLEEGRETLSWAARTVLAEAESAAHAHNLVHNYGFSLEEYDEAMGKMRRAAEKLTDRDRELLGRLWRAALAAAASIDPDDYETPVGHRAYAGDLHRYYRMASGMVEDTLVEHKRREERRKVAELDSEDVWEIQF